jgi:hypothetical protein
VLIGRLRSCKLRHRRQGRAIILRKTSKGLPGSAAVMRLTCYPGKKGGSSQCDRLCGLIFRSSSRRRCCPGTVFIHLPFNPLLGCSLFHGDRMEPAIQASGRRNIVTNTQSIGARLFDGVCGKGSLTFFGSTRIPKGDQKRKFQGTLGPSRRRAADEPVPFWEVNRPVKTPRCQGCRFYDDFPVQGCRL